MGLKQLPLMQVLDLAIGTPEIGCLNLNLVYVVLKALITHNKLENMDVDAEDIGLPEGFDFGGGLKDQKDMKNRMNDMWALLKTQKRVEANKEGIDHLFELLSGMINGDTPMVTWAKLDEHLHHGGEETHYDIERTLRDLDDAKTFFADDPEKMKEIAEKQKKIQARKERFMAQDTRKSTAGRQSMLRTIENMDFDEDEDEDSLQPSRRPQSKQESQGGPGSRAASNDRSTPRGGGGGGARGSVAAASKQSDAEPASSQPASRPQSKAEPESTEKDSAQSKPESKSESRPESKVGFRPESGQNEEKRESRAGSRPETKADSRPETSAKSRPKSKAESGPESGAESRPESNQIAKSRPKSKAESGPESGAESRPESKVESKPATPDQRDKREKSTEGKDNGGAAAAAGGKAAASSGGGPDSRAESRGDRETRQERARNKGNEKGGGGGGGGGAGGGGGGGEGRTSTAASETEKQGPSRPSRAANRKRIGIVEPERGGTGGGAATAEARSISSRASDRDPSSERYSTSRASESRASSMWLSGVGEEATQDAQKTLGGLGQMALFRGVTEEKLEMHTQQLKILMKFRNTMVQGNLMSNLMKLLGEGGLEALSRLIDSEKKEGGGIESMKENVDSMQQGLDELLRKTDMRNEEVDEMFEDLIDKQAKLKDEIMRQSEAISELTAHIEDMEREIKLLKEKVAHLDNIKADRLWVLMELSKKVDDAVLTTLVTHDEFKQNLEEVGESMNELLDKLSKQSDVLRCHVQETTEGLNGKLATHVFESFRESWTAKFERLQRLIDEIMGATDGQEDAAFLKMMKFHCASCDRPSRIFKQPATPALPAIQGMNKSKSAAPYAVFGQSTIRKNLRSNNNAALTASASGILMTPIQKGNVLGYKDAVADKRKTWKEKVERSKDIGANNNRGGGGGGSNGDATGANNERSGLDERAIERKPMLDFSNSAYYRTSEPGVMEDVWRQDRACGGESTKTIPPQRVPLDASFAKDTALGSQNVGYLVGQKLGPEGVNTNRSRQNSGINRRHATPTDQDEEGT